MSMPPERMAEIHARCFTTPRPWRAAEFAALCASPHVFACTCAKGAEGFALGRVIAAEAELLTLAVIPDMQGRGIGRGLLGRFEEAARRRGAERAFLEVSQANTRAIALYRAAGYTESGRRSGYYRGGDGRRADAILMHKPLC